MADQKFFPIKQGVACQLKWTWNTLRLAEASSAVCHRVAPVKLTTENFNDIHNHPTWVQHRELQMQGVFPQQGCQYCEQIEKAGGVSDRILHLQEPDMYPAELDVDSLATHVTPRILEVFINNRCNLACIYCDESNSTRILKENTKFGYAITGIKDSSRMIPKLEFETNYQELLDKFFDYLDSKYNQLRKLNVLGGEPFYQKEFFRLVDFIASKKNPDLEFTVVSNLMVSRSVLEDFVEKMKWLLARKHIKRLDITASIDCLGPEQEYVRYGIDLQRWTDNFEFLAQHKWIYIKINNVITSLTLRTLPDLLTYINGVRKHRSIFHAFGLVDGRPHLHPEIFGQGYFNEYLDHTISLMSRSDRWEQTSIAYMQGIKSRLNHGHENLTEQRNLKLYLDEIDRRRKTDWKSTFRWLDSYFRQCNVV
jgi:organic radical activating enzyme